MLAYAMECFGMEYLSKSYEKLNEIVLTETGKWMGIYRFLGEGDIEMIKRCLCAVEKMPVTWKEGMLRPLKSVIFEAPLKEHKVESGCHNCEQCENVTCSFREVMQEGRKRKEKILEAAKEQRVYSYGISRIFTKE